MVDKSKPVTLQLSNGSRVVTIRWPDGSPVTAAQLECGHAFTIDPHTGELITTTRPRQLAAWRKET
jgi:hypothetical protein